jgi:hypothetical protein
VVGFTTAEDSVHGVVNDADEPIVKSRGHLAVATLHGQNQRLVVGTVGALARSGRYEAQRSGIGRGGPRQDDS